MPALPSVPLAISLGDPAGIGPEVIAKCWDSRDAFGLPPFVAIGDPRSVAAIWDGPIEVIDDPRQADSAFDVGLPLIQLNAPHSDMPGHPSVAGAHCSLDSLEIAVGLTRSGSAAAVVTGPVAKEQLYAIGFQHPGQTEFVAERCGVSPGNVVMMLAGPTLRTVPVTTHLPLSEVQRHLTSALIESRGRAALRGLQRNFGIPEPRLAISGLNPHAGEGGLFGREEIDVIAPAVAAAAARGIACTGPYPADTVYLKAFAGQFDGVLSMYHDQGQIATKLKGFNRGVTVTAGLSTVFTTPAHGTAFDIVGKGVASTGALEQAIRLCARLARESVQVS